MMPTIAASCGDPNVREHQPDASAAGYVSADWFALVHTPVSIPSAMKIPAAKEAIDKEWQKLIDLRAWTTETVREKREVMEEARQQKKKVHFGSLMDLCHEKHSELAPENRKYKGRVVFRGDQVKDETGFYAVFSEQGTSASHLAAAKFLDAIARMPGNNGEDSDAVGAYTQAELGGEETWISLPYARRPKAWQKFAEPVCRLRLNLYGHPLAGLYWEKHCQKILFKAGFEAVRGWECLYLHRREQLFLSVYVDDFKMAGKKENLAKMWSTLGKDLDLEKPVSLDENVYLGCGQKTVKMPAGLLEQKGPFVTDILLGEGKGRISPNPTAQKAGGNLTH